MKKTLYDLLRVPRDASNEEIKEAYARQMARFQSEESPTDTPDHSKFYKDAYDILSNPVRRKQYDESLAAKAEPQVIFVEETRGLDLKVIGLIGILVLGGGWFYLDHSRELERLKVERSSQLIREQQALEKERLEQQALAEQTRLGFTQQNINQRQTISERQERQQDNLYFERLRQQEESAERRNKSEEEQRRNREQREAEARERNERNRVQADSARQKAWVERAERERYGYRQ